MKKQNDLILSTVTFCCNLIINIPRVVELEVREKLAAFIHLGSAGNK